MTPFELLTNGELVNGTGPMDVINPAIEEVVASCPRADLNQLNAAVAAAKAAFPAWAATPLKERGALLRQLRQALRGRRRTGPLA